MTSACAALLVRIRLDLGFSTLPLLIPLLVSFAFFDASNLSASRRVTSIRSESTSESSMTDSGGGGAVGAGGGGRDPGGGGGGSGSGGGGRGGGAD